MSVKLCRFRTPAFPWTRVGALVEPDVIRDLSSSGITRLSDLLHAEDPLATLQSLLRQPHRHVPLAEARLVAPVDRQEIWAAGVTYLRSKKARMEESDFSATAYDRVYEAPRPEIFFKSLAQKVVCPGLPVGIRSDARWNVPEPELALVLNPAGKVVGYTIGNDMSSRDIEGENLLYLPQAKTYRSSCAIGPVITLGVSESEARSWTVQIQIQRNGQSVFQGETSVSQIKRTFDELAQWLFRCQKFEFGAILLTGTGIVPPDSFTLAAGDQVRISISGIGALENPVAVV